MEEPIRIKIIRHSCEVASESLRLLGMNANTVHLAKETLKTALTVKSNGHHTVHT